MHGVTSGPVSDTHRTTLVMLVGTAALSVAFDFTTLDLRAESWFLNNRMLQSDAAMALWTFLYRYGTWPALGIGIGATVMLVPCALAWRWTKRCRSSLYVTLALLIGPGLLVNIVLKDHWGRPRPRDVEAAKSWFHAQFVPGFEGHFTSFACGHASAGFFLCCLYFVFRSNRPMLAVTCLLSAIAYGSLMGMSRMAVGAHYPSDVVWAALIPWYVAYGLERILPRPAMEMGEHFTIQPVRPCHSIRHGAQC